MTKLKLLSTAAILSALAMAPSLAQARTHVRHHHHHHHDRLPYEISYIHNYGPGRLPGTLAYYDGPSTKACAQSAAAYRGQDRHKHPCN